jgi:hypothetical protein
MTEIITFPGRAAHVPPNQWQRTWIRRSSREGEDPVLAAIENHRMANAAKIECYAEADRLLAKHGESFDFDTYTDASYNDVWDTLNDLIKTVPTTVPSMMAMLIYTRETSSYLDFNQEAETIFETLGAAAAALIGRTV